ncbi:hypothetical protein RND81_04G139400 [Saponaria officinalis]|uniref:Uncharacterized protein n=1 Tax=Saponaria officinalis TaxID=3572 RepID=A0AAW1LLX4_SAPOF
MQGKGKAAVDFTGSSTSAARVHSTGDDEVSFVLNLYTDGFSVVKASENGDGEHPALQDGLQCLRPYDRTSADFFAAIESGRLPSGILDEFPCKFVQGAITCEVSKVFHSICSIHDYRKCTSGESATITKVRLKLSLEDVVKDISLMADDSWTYGDLIEVESRVVNALHPKLCLDPVPRLDRLSENPGSLKIDLGLAGLRKRRLRQTPEFSVTSDNQRNGKKICTEEISEFFLFIYSCDNLFFSVFKSQAASENQTPMPDPAQGHTLPPGPSSVGEDMPISYVDNMNSTFNDKASRGPDGPDDNLPQHSSVDGFQEADPDTMNAVLQMLEAELFDIDSPVHPSLQMEKDQRNEEQFSKTTSIPSPRLSVATAVTRPPTSVRSAKNFARLKGAHREAVSSAAASEQVISEKAGATSSTNDFIQEQHQADMIRSNSFQTNPEINGDDSFVILDRTDDLENSSDLFISTPQVTDHNMLERFAKMKIVTTRHQLNYKKNKVEEFPKKPRAFSAHRLQGCLASTANNEYYDGSRALSRSLIGGNVNVCKMRVVSLLSDIQGHMLPARVRTSMILSENPDDGTVAVHHGRLNEEDYFEVEDNMPTLPNTHYADLLAEQFCALIIREGYTIEEVIRPRPPRLDSRPSQSQSMRPISDMFFIDDLLSRLHSFCVIDFDSIGQLELTGGTIAFNSSAIRALPTSEMHMSQGHMSGVVMPAAQHQMDLQQPLQQQPHQNQLSMMQQVPSQLQLMPPNNSMPQLNAFEPRSNLPVSYQHPVQQAQSARQQQMDSERPLQLQLHHNQPSIQRAQLIPLNNSMPQLNGSNLLVRNQMGNTMLQQPVQQAQPPQWDRRMMTDIGTAMGMANYGNNTGFGGFGAAGISTATGPVSVIGRNMGQNTIGLTRAGIMTPQAFVATQRLQMMQNHGMLGGPQSGISGASRLMQWTTTSQTQMGGPNMMPGMNVPLNQQQFQYLQQMLHQQQQLRQRAFPQQVAMSPHQAALPPQQFSSPSTFGIPLQMNPQYAAQQYGIPQQMAQQTPMITPFMSAPAHQTNGGNPDALSSQTPGSVGGIPNSFMDFQGLN